MAKPVSLNSGYFTFFRCLHVQVPIGEQPYKGWNEVPWPLMKAFLA